MTKQVGQSERSPSTVGAAASFGITSAPAPSSIGMHVAGWLASSSGKVDETHFPIEHFSDDGHTVSSPQAMP